jgi:hypothetical protein
LEQVFLSFFLLFFFFCSFFLVRSGASTVVVIPDIFGLLENSLRFIDELATKSGLKFVVVDYFRVRVPCHVYGNVVVTIRKGQTVVDCGFSSEARTKHPGMAQQDGAT